ncbi:hypothetical protein Golomagni_08220, partial [Golovinomyces magnicellulatus]
MGADSLNSSQEMPPTSSTAQLPCLFPGVAFITGAGSGIGRQTAVSFAIEGCTKIAIADRDPLALDETKLLISAASPTAEVLILPMDVRLDKDVVLSVDAVIERFKRIDYSIHCAGIFGPQATSVDLEPHEFDTVMAVNCRGVWMCSREVTKQMKLQEPLPTHDGRPGSRGSI